VFAALNKIIACSIKFRKLLTSENTSKETQKYLEKIYKHLTNIFTTFVLALNFL